MSSNPSLHEFRQQVRSFVRSKLPGDIREAVRSGQPVSRERSIAWNRLLAAEGFLVPHWPRQWGGGAGRYSSRWSLTKRCAPTIARTELRDF
ncbi:acyl-CoA dehydrogenase family protein (plasmid) [Polaromonas sp. P1-6]|nr:acyl-CoA dehydrogenase family protein [Polaromonas sp. P1-6]